MKTLALAALTVLTASQTFAADLPERSGVRAYSPAGTVWRPGPPPGIHRDRLYVRVVPVYQRRYVETRTTLVEARPRYTK